MDLTNFDFSLRWPKQLFLWEARRIAALGPKSGHTNMIICLLSEAFYDGDIAESLEPAGAAGPSWPPTLNGPPSESSRVLDALIQKPDQMHPYEKPRYWLERQSGSGVVVSHRSLAAELVELIWDLSVLGYFPDALPKACVDDPETQNADPSEDMRRAIHADVSWPLDPAPDAVPDDVLYSVVEYFHDQARRPRTRSYHGWGDCGWHYEEHNRESGAAVYRWRVNELLERHHIELKLGTRGSEKGRLIRHANLELDDLANELITETISTEDEKVAAAIRLYRARTSGVHEQRAAITQLAGYLERHRPLLKVEEFAKGDESDLFNIFNNFAIRHDNERQKNDYGEEYLDWVFWMTLAGIRLVMKLRGRSAE